MILRAVPHRAQDHGFLFKFSATLLSFFVMGLIISTPGVILPHLEAYFHLNDIQASLIFLAGPVGYLVGARLNAPIHRRLGQRGIATIAPICQIIFTGTVATFHRPEMGGFQLFLLTTAIGQVGTGLLDGSWCAWAGGLGGHRTNTVQGLLHGSFSLGAGLGPFLAGTMFSVAKTPWWSWYYVLLGAVVCQGLVLCLAFRLEDSTRYHNDLDQPLEPARPKGIFRYPVLWTCAAYFLAYVGTEGAISGWIVTFMLRARAASTFLASLSSSCFWIGMSAGRLLLGTVTDQLGVRSATAGYLLLAVLAQILLAVVNSAPVSVAAVAAVGFFLGPIFPSGIVMVARLLPKELHVAAVSFVCSVGQVGAAVLPFALGSLAQWLGIRVFQVFILAMLMAALLLWWMFPDVDRRSKAVRGCDHVGSRDETSSH
ncbi:hypothetical protein M406DRAFT_64905 [Cryphonectria parasitica EP155]|uniref:Major facilitator superfamily (MFS) profile domain-containing protein n=1 Tax=Cryphonectria parasitica (strain ATCC 38755 / EP155) TaxID=660469 RepID=A0A9P5CL28_CRYP1|nr:uncharacterized protein M406DRAFT_64905 [Cryphonectria parasitica EP155]KAF3761792.1 hypothetical protein M406DRAFT_64905 [Cryphonectria parasitica EP155]